MTSRDNLKQLMKKQQLFDALDSRNKVADRKLSTPTNDQ